MKQIQSALSSIYDRTGVASAVYSAFGELLLSTGGAKFEFKLPAAEAFDGNIARSGGVTYLRVKRGATSYYVLLGGDDDVTANYAFFIDTLIGSEEEKFRDSTSVEEKLQLLLSGELSAVRRNMLRAYFSDVRFCHYILSLVTATPEMQKNLRGFIDTVSDKRDYVVTMGDRTLVYLRYAGDESEEYRSAGEFASVLYENIKEELRIDLVVSTGGTVRAFHELSSCYEKLIFTYKFGRLISPEANVYNYKDYVLLRILADTPKSLLMKYFDSLLEKNCADVIADPELMDTADEFMKNSLNISETDRKSVV